MGVYRVFFAVVVAFSQIRDASSTAAAAANETGEASASDIVRKVIAKGCAKKYTMTCFKMDMVDLVDVLSDTPSYALFPGVAVVADNAAAVTRKSLPDALVRSLASDFPYGEDRQLDEYLVGRIGEYLATHSVSLKLLAADDNEGRGKGTKGHHSLMAGIMMMKGTLMTIGFGALAALAGKALMTGLLSLVLSALLGFRSSGSGHGHKQTTYEIISKPIYSHSHSHSAEIQHEHEHAHSHAGAYSYGRNLDYADAGNGNRGAEVEYIQLPAGKEDEERVRGYDYGNVEYKTISDDDLKNYYNNLEYAASRNREVKYRKQKGFPVKDHFVPLTTAAPATAPK